MPPLCVPAGRRCINAGTAVPGCLQKYRQDSIEQAFGLSLREDR